MKKLIILCLLVCGLCGCSNHNDSIIIKNKEKIKLKDDILSISQIWNIGLQYSPFWGEDKLKKWNDGYVQAISDLSMISNEYDKLVIEQKLLSLLDDGHVIIFPNDEVKKHVGFLPYKFDFFQGKYYIISKVGENNIPIGSEIVTIEGMSAKDYINLYMKPLIPVKTKGAIDSEAIKRLEYGEIGTSIEMEIVKPSFNNKETVKMNYYIGYNDYDKYDFKSPKKLTTKKFNKIYNSDNYTLLQIEEGKYYIKIKSFFDNNMIFEFENNIYPFLKNSSDIILDVRENNGGNSENGKLILTKIFGLELKDEIGYVQKKDNYLVSIASIQSVTTTMPITTTIEEVEKGLKMMGNQYLEEIDLDTNNKIMTKLEPIYFQGKAFVLSSYKSGSAVDDFLAYCKQIKNIEIIGTNSRGATGMIGMFPLSNESIVSLSIFNVKTYDEQNIQNIGIIPNILVEPSIEDYVKGKDTQLEYVLNYIKKGDYSEN